MSAQTMREITEAHPELSDFGFGVFDERAYRQDQPGRQAEIDKNRALLFEPESLEQFERARLWLRRQLRTKLVPMRGTTSYGLKHAAEKDIGYVTNGVFIAAAIAEGFKIVPDGPNARLNVGKKLVTGPVAAGSAM